jgi:hypothetical protein
MGHGGRAVEPFARRVALKWCMDATWILLAVVAWLALQRWILPRSGVST